MLNKATYMRAVGDYQRPDSTRSSVARIIREEAAARGERCAFHTTIMDDESYHFDNGASMISGDIGIRPRAPLPTPLAHVGIATY
jgi:hypothetical protein